MIATDDYSLSYDHAVSVAAERGQTILEPADNELFIDLDTEDAYEDFLAAYEILNDQEPMIWVAYTSKSGPPHRHVRVRLERSVTPQERIMLQAILGSDRKREALSYLRMKVGNEHATLFFEANPAQAAG